MTVSAEWIDGLRLDFSGMREAFDNAQTIEKRRRIAGAMIAVMLQSLSDLGALETDAAQPIIEVLHMFKDLNDGRRHPWAAVSSYCGSRKETSNLRELRLAAVVCMMRLVGEGSSVSKAAGDVAKLLKAKGRQATLAGIRSWYYRPRTSEDELRVREAMAAGLGADPLADEGLLAWSSAPVATGPLSGNSHSR